MPGFISHTVMAHDVYQRLKYKNVNLEYMTTYSLGGDLSKYAKCRYDSHHKDQDKFIYNMADYIKSNDLVNDREIMAVLYAHICHYIMDDVIHPLVRKVDKTCARNKKNHTLIEEYYDTYLVQKIIKVSKRKYANGRIISAKVGKKISKMLDFVYYETYTTKKVSKYYKFNLFLYRILRNIYRLFGTKIVGKIMGLDKFLLVNKKIDLVNDNGGISYQNSLLEDQNLSLMELYDESVLLALEYIKAINKYLEI